MEILNENFAYCIESFCQRLPEKVSVYLMAAFSRR